MAALLAFFMTLWSVSPLMALATYVSPGIEIESVAPTVDQWIAKPSHAGHAMMEHSPLDLGLMGDSEDAACPGMHPTAGTMAGTEAGATSEAMSESTVPPQPTAKANGCCCKLGAMLCTACDMDAAAGSSGAPAFKGLCGIPGDSEQAPVPSALAKFLFDSAKAPGAHADSGPRALQLTDIPEDIFLSPSFPPPKGKG